MTELLTKFLSLLHIPSSLSSTAQHSIVLLSVLCLAISSYFIIKIPLIRYIKYIIAKTKNNWDDLILNTRALHYIAYLLPGIIIYYSIPLMGSLKVLEAPIFQKILTIYLTVITLLIFNALLNTLLAISQRINASWQIPFKMFIHIVKLFTYILSVILIVSILIDKSPLFFLSGLGAFTAILMLIFKDSILGFVSGIQLAMNDMLHIGDWIEMPQYGADGSVVEIALTTIKVKNWDQTVSTVPTYALISDSFKNWRTMETGEGRRIKRAIYIDMSSIKFCDETMLNNFKDINILSSYINDKLSDISQYNNHVTNNQNTINTRQLTNIGIFRAYADIYINNHPNSHKTMTQLTRQLPPGKHGLPIEIYFFSTEKQWASYENIQSDIFDHLLAILPLFELNAFQLPTGKDITRFKEELIKH
jgi:miniconductance mechanosensitive channel